MSVVIQPLVRRVTFFSRWVTRSARVNSAFYSSSNNNLEDALLLVDSLPSKDKTTLFQHLETHPAVV